MTTSTQGGECDKCSPSCPSQTMLTPHGAHGAGGAGVLVKDSLPWLCLHWISEKKLPVLPGTLQSSRAGTGAHVEWLAVCWNFKLTWVSRVLNGYAWHLQQRLPWPHPFYPSPGESLSNDVLPVLKAGDSSVGSHRNLLIPRLKSPEETQRVGL